MSSAMRLRADNEATITSSTAPKLWITNGHYAETLVVLCQDPARCRAARHHRLSDRKGFKGFRPSAEARKLGMRGSPTSELVFEDCECQPKTCSAWSTRCHVLMSGSTTSGAILAAGPLGISSPGLDVVIPYIHDRKQFGRRIASSS